MEIEEEVKEDMHGCDVHFFAALKPQVFHNVQQNYTLRIKQQDGKAALSSWAPVLYDYNFVLV